MKKSIPSFFLLLFFCGTLLAAGCSPSARKVSNPASALLGSWKPANSGGAAIYFGYDTATYVPHSGGESIKVRYEVLSEDGADRSIELRYLGSSAADQPFRITFSNDWERFCMYPAGAPEVLEYIYVNDRQEP